MSTVAICPKSPHTGKPFNIASSALMTRTLAQQCDQAREQLFRTPGERPRLTILRRPSSIDGYVAQPHIKAGVAI